MRYLSLLFILLSVLLVNCSKEKSTSILCEEFSDGHITHLNKLISRNAQKCFMENILNPSEPIRNASAKGLDTLNGLNDISLLKKLVNDNSAFIVRLALLKIAQTQKRENIFFILKLLNHKKALIRRMSIFSLHDISYKKALKKISSMINDSNAGVRIAAALFVTKMKAVEYISKIENSLNTETDQFSINVKTECVEILKNINSSINDSDNQ